MLTNVTQFFYCMNIDQAILDPQLAAMKKIRKMQRKKEAKKRKLSQHKNPVKNYNSKKLKLNSNDDDDY